MSADNRQDAGGSVIVAFKEIQGGFDQLLDEGKQLAMGDLTAEMSPKHFYGIEPGTSSTMSRNTYALNTPNWSVTIALWS